jgi:hypothetical protein
MFRKKIIYLDLSLEWNRSKNSEHPFYTQYNGHNLQIRLNDFPDEHLYSIIEDEKPICDFDDWPENWGIIN